MQIPWSYSRVSDSEVQAVGQRTGIFCKFLREFLCTPEHKNTCFRDHNEQCTREVTALPGGDRCAAHGLYVLTVINSTVLLSNISTGNINQKIEKFQSKHSLI